MVRHIDDPAGPKSKPLKADNDNGLDVEEVWPEVIFVTENELRLLETRFTDIISEIVAANDNNP